MSYGVEWEQDAGDALDRLDTPIVHRILRRIDWLSANLDNIKPEVLTGKLAGYFRLRAGDYRIIYRIRREDRLIVIEDLGHRRNIYKDK